MESGNAWHVITQHQTAVAMLLDTFKEIILISHHNDKEQFFLFISIMYPVNSIYTFYTAIFSICLFKTSPSKK